jgi:hypothetical protein
VQGSGNVNGTPGWMFRADITRDLRKPASSVVTVTVWRPGITTVDNPDLRYGGRWRSGNVR